MHPVYDITVYDITWERSQNIKNLIESSKLFGEDNPMTRKMSVKRAAMAVPKDLAEAAEFLAEIGREHRRINENRNRFNEQVEKLKAVMMESVAERNSRIDQLVEGLAAFAETHRQELTDGGKRKTVELPTGTFGWRLTPPAVSLRNVKQILESIKHLGLTQFIRVKEEIDKEAMLAECETASKIKGVSIGQREEFVVKPSDLEIEITARAAASSGK